MDQLLAPKPIRSGRKAAGMLLWSLPKGHALSPTKKLRYTLSYYASQLFRSYKRFSYLPKSSYNLYYYVKSVERVKVLHKNVNIMTHKVNKIIGTLDIQQVLVQETLFTHCS